jgi:hypothetical protein
MCRIAQQEANRRRSLRPRTPLIDTMRNRGRFMNQALIIDRSMLGDRKLQCIEPACCNVDSSVKVCRM